MAKLALYILSMLPWWRIAKPRAHYANLVTADTDSMHKLILSAEQDHFRLFQYALNCL